MSLKEFADTLPDYAKDLRLNLSSVLSDQLLGDQRKYGLLLSCAHGTGYRPLVAAAEAEVEGKLTPEAANAARGATAIMAMNNVFYRSRHMLGKPSYESMPARLRMTRIAQPASNKLDLELFCIAVSTVNGCEVCLRAHEKVVLEGGFTEQQVLDAIRIAAVVRGAAAALELV